MVQGWHRNMPVDCGQEARLLVVWRYEFTGRCLNFLLALESRDDAVICMEFP